VCVNFCVVLPVLARAPDGCAAPHCTAPACATAGWPTQGPLRHADAPGLQARHGRGVRRANQRGGEEGTPHRRGGGGAHGQVHRGGGGAVQHTQGGVWVRVVAAPCAAAPVWWAYRARAAGPSLAPSRLRGSTSPPLKHTHARTRMHAYHAYTRHTCAHTLTIPTDHYTPTTHSTPSRCAHTTHTYTHVHSRGSALARVRCWVRCGSLGVHLSARRRAQRRASRVLRPTRHAVPIPFPRVRGACGD
jgi:hypothetical protein